MAWSMSDYWEFVHEVMDEYDLSVSEARGLYGDVRGGFDRSLYGEDVSQYEELIEEILVAGYGFEYADYDYELDDRFVDDDWIDAGDDVEITAELAYE